MMPRRLRFVLPACWRSVANSGVATGAGFAVGVRTGAFRRTIFLSS